MGQGPYGPGPKRDRARDPGPSHTGKETSAKTRPEKNRNMGVLECLSLHPDKVSKYGSSGQTTMTMRRASKFCARRRFQIPNIFYLDPIHRGIPGMKEPWPECQSVFLGPKITRVPLLGTQGHKGTLAGRDPKLRQGHRRQPRSQGYPCEKVVRPWYVGPLYTQINAHVKSAHIKAQRYKLKHYNIIPRLNLNLKHYCIITRLNLTLNLNLT